MKATTIGTMLLWLSRVFLVLMITGLFEFSKDWKTFLDPISNILYFFFSMWSLYLFRHWGRKKLLFIILNLIMIAVLVILLVEKAYIPYYRIAVLVWFLLDSMSLLYSGNLQNKHPS